MLQPPHGGMKIDARADVIRNNSDAFAEFGETVARADVDLAVLFGELFDPRLRIFNDVAEAAVGDGGCVSGERLGAGVNDNLAGDGIADDGGDDAGGAVVDGGESRPHGVHVVEHVRAGPHFGDVRREVRLISGRRRTSGNDRGAQSVLLPQGERFGDEVIEGFELCGLFVWFAPDLAWVDHEAVESQIWIAVDCLGKR